MSDPPGPSGTDGAVTGAPSAPSNRTWAMPPTVQVAPETLRSRTVVQIVPAAPSVPATDARSAAAWQRTVAGWPADDPLVDDGGVVGADVWGGVVDDGGADAAGWAVLVWTVQPVTATVARMTAAMVLAGRMAAPPKQHDPGWVR
jgi:hypothetical protein